MALPPMAYRQSPRPLEPRDPVADWLRRALGQVRGAVTRHHRQRLAKPIPRTYSHTRAEPQGRRSTYGRQARPQSTEGPYVVVFLLMIGILAAFLYFGLNWATGSGRLTGLGIQPTPIPATPTAAPSPTVAPTLVPTTYVVKPGDNPGAIAREHGITVERLLEANNISDPRALQIGQVLKIPPRP